LGSSDQLTEKVWNKHHNDIIYRYCHFIQYLFHNGFLETTQYHKLTINILPFLFFSKHHSQETFSWQCSLILEMVTFHGKELHYRLVIKEKNLICFQYKVRRLASMTPRCESNNQLTSKPNWIYRVIQRNKNLYYILMTESHSVRKKRNNLLIRLKSIS
jgi:hypothetical protein